MNQFNRFKTFYSSVIIYLYINKELLLLRFLAFLFILIYSSISYIIYYQINSYQSIGTGESALLGHTLFQHPPNRVLPECCDAYHCFDTLSSYYPSETPFPFHVWQTTLVNDIEDCFSFPNLTVWELHFPLYMYIQNFQIDSFLTRYIIVYLYVW